MLDFETRFDVAEGNAGMPYVSNDIGGFLLAHLPDQLYVRWIESGTFAPILRPHSDHGDRLPWDYPGEADAIASAFLRLRESLIPYTYTVARETYDTGLPITRGMYLNWPDDDDAYVYDHEYMFGPELLVAPVGTAGDPAMKTVWFPPGSWTDIFTGRRYTGPSVQTLSVPLSQMPVFARAGAIVPLAPYMDYSSERPLSPLTLDVYAGASGSFSLYEDAGQGFGYQQGQFSRTPMRWNRRRRTLTIGPARGRFPGQLRRRAYRVVLVGIGRPRAVLVDKRRRRSSYDRATRTLTLRIPATRTGRRLAIRLLA
jgi:alpha-glucosidase (family GH31 glycosyl hydrolase)